MKQILIFISLFLITICTINAQSVTANQVNGRLQMTTVSNVSDSTWSITGYFTNSVSKYLPSNINVNDKFFCQIGANTYVGRISVINSRSDVTKLITFRVICNYPNPPNNIGAIIRATSNGYPVYVDGLPNALQAGIQNYFATLINTNAAGNPCEKTITKTNHQFRKGTPVRRVGGTYVRPTNDTIIPDFIVVDSLTANTFKVSTCGLYTSTLPDGLYWFTSASPGYSLIQDTVKVPLFQVLNDTMILNPIVGFNLMAGNGGTADGNGIYSGSDSLSQENTYAAMAADGSQTFGVGSFPDFPDLNLNKNGVYGMYLSPQYWGQTGFFNTESGIKNEMFVSSSGGSMRARNFSNLREGSVSFGLGRVALRGLGNTANSKDFQFIVDSTRILIARNISGTTYNYELVPNSQYPSTASGVTNILKWTSGVPSFGYMYETDTLYNDITHIKMNKSQTLAIGQFNTAELNNDSPDYVNDVGLFISPTEWGSIDIVNKGSYVSVSDNGSVLGGNNASQKALAQTYLGGNRFYLGKRPYGTGRGRYVQLATNDFSGDKSTFFGQKLQTTNRGSGLAMVGDSISNRTAYVDYFSDLDTVFYTYLGTANNIDLSSFTGSPWSTNTIYDVNITNRRKFILGKYYGGPVTNTPFFEVDFQKASNQVRLYGKYDLANATPSATTGAISTHIWTAGTPSFLRSQHGVATGTTDGSGDLTVTFAAAMPDATYSLIATVEGTTYYTTTVHTKGTSTVKVRFFDAAGAAVTATSVTISYEAKDY